MHQRSQRRVLLRTKKTDVCFVLQYVVLLTLESIYAILSGIRRSHIL
jgi:hypothetical protein